MAATGLAAAACKAAKTAAELVILIILWGALDVLVARTLALTENCSTL